MIHKKKLVSWALYDWGNSAFMAVIQTFLFAAYFTEFVAPTKEEGTWAWGMATSTAGFTVAILAPLFGAVVDQTKNYRAWLIPFTLLCIVATALLWFVGPDPKYMLFAMVLIGLSTIGSEMAFVFYNATLTVLAPVKQVGRWSAWGYFFGYVGGVLCTAVALFVFIQPEGVWFGADTESSEHVRAVFPVVALWYLIFSLPLFAILPKAPKADISLTRAMSKGIEQIKDSVEHIKEYGTLIRFLVARMLYADALSTIFLFGGVMAAGEFGMQQSEILLFGIVLNIVAGIGVALYGMVADRLSSRSVVLFSLIFLIAVVVGILTASSKNIFWLCSLLLGSLVGPLQAASRTYLTELSPPHLISQMFGVYALSGKATSFVGPFLVGWLTWISGSQRVGVAIVVVFLLVGLKLIQSIQKIV